MPLTCVKGIWTPSTQPCTRKSLEHYQGAISFTSVHLNSLRLILALIRPGICQNITLTVSGLECFRNSKRQNCKMPLLIGTKIIPHCEKDYKPDYAKVTCNANGEWDHSAVECIPGIQENVQTHMISVQLIFELLKRFLFLRMWQPGEQLNQNDHDNTYSTIS